MIKKVKTGIIGTGNIGSDLLVKILRSPVLECGIFTGINPKSKNIKRAQKMGVPTAYDSINAIINNPDSCEIVFDATSAKIHTEHAPILKKLKKFTIDLTPSKVGKLCVPSVNLKACLEEDNVNMITCGAQATIPIINALMKAQHQTGYVEIVSSISSQSAGIGTRSNIDEYTRLTSEAIMELTFVPKAKAIVILNPSDPPIHMQNTIYAKIHTSDITLIQKEIFAAVKRLKKYVPGFALLHKPIVQNGMLVIISEVTGRGDYLPAFAGNLDVMNSAAVRVAEEYAKKRLL
ncbi:MAG: acetaldehyde dehydrogenase (acetylating) [bacterium]|nr:acetaldehyde dehydrogenase (acetylating) [bacterium]